MFDDTSATELETVLVASSGEDDLFRTLRAIDFAWYFEAITIDDDNMLQEKYTLFSCWMKCTLPRLCERYTVELYCYKWVASLGVQCE